jgi:ketosteroid isomerase-like protein
MATPALDLLRAVHFGSRGDIDAIAALYAADALLRYPGRSAVAGDHRGREQIRDFFERVIGLMEGTLRVRYGQTFEAGEYAAAVVHHTAQRVGREHAWTSMDLVIARGGTIAEHLVFQGDQPALDEFLRGQTP